MKKFVSHDEWYPVFSLGDEDWYGVEVEVSDELVARYIEVRRMFGEMQDELRVLVKWTD